MIYLILALLTTCSSFIQSAEEEVSLVEEKKPTYSSTSIHISDTTEVPDLNTHFSKIKNFLKTQSNDFSEEKRIFNTDTIFTWSGFTNKSIMQHAQNTIQSKYRTKRSSSELDDFYIQLLQDLITYSKSHDKKQKEKICKRMTIGIVGAALTASTTAIMTHLEQIT